MKEETKKISPILLTLDAALIVLVVVMFFAVNAIMSKPKPTTAPLSRDVPSTAFENIALQAKAAYVFDVAENKVIFQKNSGTQLPLASLTKLMMAAVASDMYKADSRVTIRKEFLQEDGDNGLAVGESWKLKDLLDFSLVVSSNDGARSIASVIGASNNNNIDFDIGRKDFISKMNDKAQKLGLSQMYFVNETGLDVGTVSGGYGTAENVGSLLKYIITEKPTLLEATKYDKTVMYSRTEKHTATNTDTMIDEIPGLIASKTGYTSLAGGNLAIAFDGSIGKPIIIVVLGSTQNGRFSDVSTLISASLNYIKE